MEGGALAAVGGVPDPDGLILALAAAGQPSPAAVSTEADYRSHEGNEAAVGAHASGFLVATWAD